MSENKPGAAGIRLTVMMPVRNEARFIRNTLEQLAQQTLPFDQWEVIVVDGASTDDTVHCDNDFSSAHEAMQVRLLDNPRCLSSISRNIAVQQGVGEYFLLIDGHVHIPDAAMLENALRLAVENNALCLGRPQPLNPPGISGFQRTVARARNSRLAHSQESFIYSDYEGWVSPISVAVMYHRSLFEQVGFFDEAFDASEDVEFNYRLEQAGIKCFISPLLGIVYFPRENFQQLYRQLSRYGYGRASFVRKHPERFTLETLVPAAIVIWLVCGLIISALGGLTALLWAVGTGVYILALLVEGLRLADSESGVRSLPVSLVILTIHLGLGSGFLTSVFRTGRKASANT